MVQLNKFPTNIPDSAMMKITDDKPFKIPKKKASMLRRVADGLRQSLSILFLSIGGIIAGVFAAVVIILLGLSAVVCIAAAVIAFCVCVAVAAVGSTISLVFVVPGAMITPGAKTIIAESWAESRNTPN